MTFAAYICQTEPKRRAVYCRLVPASANSKCPIVLTSANSCKLETFSTDMCQTEPLNHTWHNIVLRSLLATLHIRSWTRRTLFSPTTTAIRYLSKCHTWLQLDNANVARYPLLISHSSSISSCSFFRVPTNYRRLPVAVLVCFSIIACFSTTRHGK